MVGSTVAVPAGNSGFLVRVPTVDDNLSEPSETITLGAATAQNAAPVTGTGTITDNDGTPSLSINDVTVNEAAGTATFTVTLSNPSAAAVTVGYNTTDGTATDGNDYTGTTGSLTFAPGVTTQVVTVNIKNDGIYEGSETFNVNLSTPTNATIADNLGVGTIRDDGTGFVPPGVTPDDDRPAVASVSSPTVTEGAPLDFTVSLTHPSTTPTAVTLSPASGTATLEAALFKRPMVIAYRMGWLSWQIMRRKQMQPWVGLPNILCRDFIVPELIQDRATPQALANAVLQWLDDLDHQPAKMAALQQQFVTLHRNLRRDTSTLTTDAIEKILAR